MSVKSGMRKTERRAHDHVGGGRDAEDRETRRTTIMVTGGTLKTERDL
jgi:hypothetical protein